MKWDMFGNYTKPCMLQFWYSTVADGLYLCFCLLGSLLSLPTFELLGLGSICTGGPSSDPSEPIAGMETFQMIEYKVEMFSNDQFFKYKLLSTSC
jgi:hypothetical protein